MWLAALLPALLRKRCFRLHLFSCSLLLVSFFITQTGLEGFPRTSSSLAGDVPPDVRGASSYLCDQPTRPHPDVNPPLFRPCCDTIRPVTIKILATAAACHAHQRQMRDILSAPPPLPRAPLNGLFLVLLLFEWPFRLVFCLRISQDAVFSVFPFRFSSKCFCPNSQRVGSWGPSLNFDAFFFR